MCSQGHGNWDARYRDGDRVPTDPSPFLLSLDEVLPRAGRAIDIACGAGRHAVWLAQRGLDVTAVDNSIEGLRCASERAAVAGVSIRTRVCDVKTEPLPAGPWDLVLCSYFLERSLFDTFPRLLAPGGLLVFWHATKSNLERHDRPPAGFLLEDGELAGLAGSLAVLRCDEGWFDEGRHEARLVARKST